MKRVVSSFVIAVALSGCAQIPRESVELSNTVGRDVSAIEVSHLALIKLYFDDKEARINQWVDQVYAPSQITAVVGNAAIRAELETAINNAAAGQNQDVLVKRFNSVITLIRDDVEKTRGQLMSPIESARADTLTRVQAAYTQVQLGNSIVTGYLSSLVKVTDTQNQLLAGAGLSDTENQLSADMISLSENLDKALTSSADKCRTLASVVQALSKFSSKASVPTTDACN
jgi:hypothetical protein